MKELTANGEFRSVYHHARLNILYTAICIGELDRAFMETFDLTPQQHNILRIVYHSKKPMNVLQIRERMFEKLSDASRLIDRLELKELLKKEKSKSDKRLVEISLTEKGIALVEKIDKTLHHIDDPLRGLTEEEAEKLSELLSKLRKTGTKNQHTK